LGSCSGSAACAPAQAVAAAGAAHGAGCACCAAAACVSIWLIWIACAPRCRRQPAVAVHKHVQTLLKSLAEQVATRTA